MANYTVSPNMGLAVPTVGVDPGPDWANNLNADLTVLDSHNHAPGSGVQINPNGININQDLPFNNNNATLLRSVRFNPQSTTLALITDIGCLYETGVDLYYNDGNGNQIRITQSGGIAGTPGSIGGLVPPASVTYVSVDKTFVFQSAASTPANIDVASIILRNLVANSKGLTLSPPNAMANDYTITLPALPSTTSVLTMDTSGNISTSPLSAPTLTVLTSGSGTYTVPGGVGYLKIRMIGGGGGGGGGGGNVNGNTPGSPGTSGGNTTFGTSVLVCNGGAFGDWDQSPPNSGIGGTATINSPAYGIAYKGGDGSGPPINPPPSSFMTGGVGASSPFGGAGGAADGSNNSTSSVDNTGSGGPGGGSYFVGGGGTEGPGGSGGGAGGYIEAYIPSPLSSYSYSVGTGGAGGAGGNGGSNGGNGGSGVIIIEEHYLG